MSVSSSADFIGKTYIGNLPKTIPEAFERIGVKTFSEQACEQYMQAKLEEVWQNSGIGGVFLGRHPVLFERRHDIGPALFFVGLVAMIVMSLAHAKGLLFNVVFYAVGFMISLLGAIFPSRILKLALAGAIQSEWTKSEFVPNTDSEPEDLSAHGKKLTLQLQALLPNASFYVERLKKDPFIGISLDNEYCRFHGWNGNMELVEIGGKIMETPAL